VTTVELSIEAEMCGLKLGGGDGAQQPMQSFSRRANPLYFELEFIRNMSEAAKTSCTWICSAAG
jgi:hypothetical protein